MSILRKTSLFLGLWFVMSSAFAQVNCPNVSEFKNLQLVTNAQGVQIWVGPAHVSGGYATVFVHGPKGAQYPALLQGAHPELLHCSHADVPNVAALCIYRGPRLTDQVVCEDFRGVHGGWVAAGRANLAYAMVAKRFK